MWLKNNISAVFLFASGLLPATILSAQHRTTVDIRIIDGSSGRQTSAMASIVNLSTNETVMPPDGLPAGTATYPSPFFKGIFYSPSPEWVGPLRRMAGESSVNGQRTYVYGDRPSLPYWKDSMMYQVNGRMKIRLSPGKYRVSLQHGLEYVPLVTEIEISDHQPDTLMSLYLRRWIDLPVRGWYSGDVHAHHVSATKNNVRYLQQLARAEDVHVLNVLEMGDRQSTYFKVKKFGPKGRVRDGKYLIVYGQEEPRSDYGHVIGMNIGSLARDTSRYNQYGIVFDRIHQHPGALVGFAHFAYAGEGVSEGMALFASHHNIDFLEVLQNTQLNSSGYYDVLNMGFRIAATAGSDFPWGSTVGDGRTFVYTGNVFNADRWFDGVKRGRTFVSNGPALFLTSGDYLPGDVIKAAPGDTLEFNVIALGDQVVAPLTRVDLIVNGRQVISQTNAQGKDSLHISFRLPITSGAWIAASAVGANGSVAHTSPVYVDIGDGMTFDRKRAPGLIDEQLRILEGIEQKERSNGAADPEIIERIEKARKAFLERKARVQIK